VYERWERIEVRLVGDAATAVQEGVPKLPKPWRVESPNIRPERPQDSGCRHPENVSDLSTERYVGPVRVLFCGPVPPHVGGISQHSERLIEALRTLRHDVTVIGWKNPYPSALYKGPDISWDTSIPSIAYLLKWWNPLTWYRVRRLALVHDILLFPHVTPFHAIPERVLSAGRVPTIGFVHNALPHERMPFQASFTRLALAHCNSLVAHDSTVVDALRHLGIKQDVFIAPMPALLSFPPTKPPTGPLNLLMFGTLRPYKGIETAIRAASALVKRGIEVQLTIVGKAWEPTEPYQRLIANLDLAGRVTLTDRYISDDELRHYVELSSMVLAPYTQDTLSAVVPTALASGRPVVASDVAGIRSQVLNGVNGVLVRPSDPSALADGVVAVQANLAVLSSNAAGHAATWEDVARAVVKAAHP